MYDVIHREVSDKVPVILGLCHLLAHYNLRSLESLQGSSLSAPTDGKDSE